MQIEQNHLVVAAPGIHEHNDTTFLASANILVERVDLSTSVTVDKLYLMLGCQNFRSFNGHPSFSYAYKSSDFEFRAVIQASEIVIDHVSEYLKQM